MGNDSNDSKQKTGPSERRTERRESAADYHSVAFQPRIPGPIYQFKIRDISSHGMCILVKSDSNIVDHLHVGMDMEMTYYGETLDRAGKKIRTRIAHITPENSGRYKGHLLVGLSVSMAY